ncbi:MAG: histidine phosphatase family protein [Pseudomonadales bacterium]
MASIYLIRHGQASFGTDDYDRLSDLGHQQAQLLGQYLFTTGVKIDGLYAGSLRRQQETANGITAIFTGQGMQLPELVTDPRLDEIDNEGQVRVLAPIIAEHEPAVADLLEQARSSSKHYQKLLEKVFRYWQMLPKPLHGQESWPMFQTRTQAAMFAVIKQQGAGKDSLMVTSGGVIATLSAWVLALPDSAVYQFYEPLLNASITRVMYNRDKMSLSYFNDHSFLALLGAQTELGNAVTYR